MADVDLHKIGLKVGLEIHQQLATNKKLFCRCRQVESESYPIRFSRRLRLTKSELGRYDPAAVFESSKSKVIVYNANPESSCLVEYDDEPPHELDLEAKTTALIIASALHSSIFNESYVMRKMVIDGSNTSGFQRTMLVSEGGHLQVDGVSVGVQSICLEEDAAKLLKDSDGVREYSLDRLGVPLVEIALAPVSGTPEQVKKIALTLGRLLRVTRRVARGIGSIRQDVNVSILGGGVVEVKGVQQLDQLEKVIAYEAKRQHGLQLIAERMQKIRAEDLARAGNMLDVSGVFAGSKSKVIQKSLKDGAAITSLRIIGGSGTFGFEPYEGIRLGRELGQLVRTLGIGGVFHSDELPNYGIEREDVEMIRRKQGLKDDDAFLLVAATRERADIAIDAIISRISEARCGVPAETRMATPTGETVFLRPRPGASRMYPETDIPPVITNDEEIRFAQENMPRPWDEAIAELQKRYGLNAQLAEQVFDSGYLDLFESICAGGKSSPNFVASVLCSTITNLERRGLDSSLLKPEHISRSFQMLSEERITKESLEIIYEHIMSGKARSVDEFVQNHAQTVDEKELEEIIDRIVSDNLEIIRRQGEHSIGMLMGAAMKTLRGKVSGEKISRLLTVKISKIVKN